MLTGGSIPNNRFLHQAIQHTLVVFLAGSGNMRNGCLTSSYSLDKFQGLYEVLT